MSQAPRARRAYRWGRSESKRPEPRTGGVYTYHVIVVLRRCVHAAFEFESAVVVGLDVYA